MKLVPRLYTANLINTFGSWLTFLAIALITQERYGSQYVAVVFLIQTLPAIFLSRSLARLIPEGRHEQVIVVANVLLALNSLVLVWNQSLLLIFAHLFAASVLRTISGPLSNSLVGKWVPSQIRGQFYIRLGALQAGTLAFAPIVGAWLKVATSVQVLFAVDAVTFLISLALQKELFRPSHGEREFRWNWRQLFGEFSPRPRGLSRETRQALTIWFMFLAVGAALNAIEFPAFEWHQLGEKEIAQALAAWGVGNLIAFAFPSKLSHRYSAAIYVLALFLFLGATGPWGVIFAFALAGVMYSFCAGSIRAQLQNTVPDGENSVSMWAYAWQITQIINLIAYALAGSLLVRLGFFPFAVALVALGLVYLATTLAVRPVLISPQEQTIVGEHKNNAAEK